MHAHPLARPVVALLLLSFLRLGIAAQAAALPEKAAAPGGNAGYTVEPVPTWVEAPGEAAARPSQATPMHYRLIDNQVLLGSGTQWKYTHVVRVVDDAAGLGTAAQIEVQFDPSDETLVFHHIDIVRGGKHYSRLDGKRIQLLQRETQLERRIYDGRITASIVLDDVRVGDQIDYDYSQRGANPVFAGHFVDVDVLGSARGPVMLFRYRLLAPPERTIAYRSTADGLKTESTLRQGLRETVYSVRDVAQLQLDPGAGFDQLLKHQLWLSEFRDWADVAAWGQALFVEPEGSAPTLDRKAAEIRQQNATSAARLLAALRFVQTEVRYFGTEIGPAAHKPAAPEQVLAQRFGDCKDKVALLVALARRLGLQATPVLVSTQLRNHLAEVLPGPQAFDHAIARIDLDGHTYWLDGTRAYQTGTLENRQAIGLDRGLPLQLGVSALADLPKAYDRHFLSVDDRFRIERFAEGAQLQSRVTYRGDLAEVLREAAASAGLSAVETQLNDAYVRLYPSLKSTAALRLEDSAEDNAVTVVQQFRIPDFWRFPEQRALAADFGYWSLAEMLRVPNMQARHDAYAIFNPGIFEHRITVEFPEDVFSAPASRRFDDGDAHFSLHSEINGTQRSVEFSGQLRWLVNSVGSDEWSAYTAKLSRIWPQLSWTTTVSAIPMNMMEDAKRDLQSLGEALQRGRIKVVTAIQRDAAVQSTVLSWQLKGGRLSPALQAQVLRERGVDYDNLGRIDEARADFEAALRLAPDAPEILASAAVNASARGDQARAVVLSSRVLARWPSDTAARDTRARAYYLMRNYAAAREDFEELLHDSAQLRRGYPLIMLALAARSAGGDAQQALRPYLNGDLPSEWPRPLIDWSSGRLDDAAVLNAARAGEHAGENLCEAYFYLAEGHLARGDTTLARDYFQKAQAQGITEYFEHFASSLELQRIGSS